MANVMESICMIYVRHIFFGLTAMENKKYVQRMSKNGFNLKQRKMFKSIVFHKNFEWH